MQNMQSWNFAGFFYWTFSVWTRKSPFFRGWSEKFLSVVVFFFISTFLLHPSSSVSSFFIHVRSSSFSLVQLTLPSLAAGQEQSPLMARLCEVNGHFGQKAVMKIWLDMARHLQKFRCTRQMQKNIHQVHTTCRTGPACFCHVQLCETLQWSLILSFSARILLLDQSILLVSRQQKVCLHVSQSSRPINPLKMETDGFSMIFLSNLGSETDGFGGS